MSKVKRTMVRCAEPGCKRLVFSHQRYCWEHKLKRRDKRIKRLTGRR